MKHIIIPVAAGLVGAAVGFYAGYRYGDKTGREAVWLVAEDEILRTEDEVKRRYKLGEYSEPAEYFDNEGEKVLTVPEGVDPKDLVKLQEHINNGGYAMQSDAPTLVEYAREDVELVTNVFASGIDPRKLAEELHEDIEDEEPFTGNPNWADPEPLIITELEYFNDEEDYEKLSVSWYPGDRVLCDSKEQPIPDVESAVGINNLNHLGVEKTTLYVRNHRLKMDFEIAGEIGSYRETVLGVDPPEMERTARRRPRNPRDE